MNTYLLIMLTEIRKDKIKLIKDPIKRMSYKGSGSAREVVGMIALALGLKIHEDEYGISSTPFKNLIDHLKYYYEHTTFDSACFNAIYKMLDDYDFTSDGEVMEILKQLKKYC